MRLSTDESRDEELALATIAAAAEAGVTVFDTARAYGRGAGELGHNERLLARALRRCGADGARADRDEGRHDAGRRRLDPRRSREGDSRRLRGESRCAGRPCDRPLPHPCARSADAVADLGARAGPARRRRPREARRALERQPPPAGRGARARSRHGRPGRAQPVRRPRPPGRSRRAVRREGDRRDRPLAARWAAPRGRARSATRRWPTLRTRTARPRPRSRSHGCSSSRPAVVAIPGARRPETARSAAPCRDARARRRRPAALARAFGGPVRLARERPRRRGDAEVVLVMGIPGAGKSRIAEEYVARGYLRLNRDERGGSLRELADALEEELVGGRRGGSSSTTRTSLARRGATRSRRRAGMESRRGASGSTRRSPRRRSTSSSGCSSASARCRLPRSCEVLARREPGLLAADLADARAPRARAAVDRRGAGRRRAGALRAPAAGRERAAGVFVAAAALRASGLGARARAGRPGRASPLFDWSPGRHRRTPSPPTSPASRPRSPARWRARCARTPAGPPSCWCRPPLPGLPLAFARAHGVDPARSILDRNRPRAPDARDDARRPLRRGWRRRARRETLGLPRGRFARIAPTFEVRVLAGRRPSTGSRLREGT